MKIWPRTQPIRVIIVHTNEGPDAQNGANGLSNFVNGQDAGYHKISDNKLTVTKAGDQFSVQGAPYVNGDGLHICGVGFAAQTRAQWLDVYSRSELDQLAHEVGLWCLKHDIPVRRLTPQQLFDGQEGIVGHIDVTNAYKALARAQGHEPLDHWDPGPNFPWDVFLPLVAHFAGRINIAELEDPDVPALTDVVDVLETKYGKWQLTFDGGVTTLDGKFYGSYFTLPEKDRNDKGRRFCAIAPRVDGNGTILPGYLLSSTRKNEVYEFSQVWTPKP